MKRTCRLLIGVTACLVASVATASDGEGNYAIWGAGSRSCNQFTRAAADATQLPTYRDYVMGYLTAFNTLAPDTYDAVGGQTLEATLSWVDSYCEQHKMDSFERALGQMVVARHEQRMRVPPGASRGWGNGSTVPSGP